MTTEALTDLQLAVMKALWRVGEGTVGDVAAAMAADGRALAPTTVATLLQRLSKQGWVAYRQRGRQFVYRACADETETARGALQRIVATFFGGKASAVAAQLIESEDLTADELDEMRKLIKAKRGG